MLKTESQIEGKRRKIRVLTSVYQDNIHHVHSTEIEMLRQEIATLTDRQWILLAEGSPAEAERHKLHLEIAVLTVKSRSQSLAVVIINNSSFVYQ